MFDTYHSFPSVKTIIKWCGGHISKTTVEKALRWLDKNGIISRGKAKTKTRFTNNIRKMVYGVKKIKEVISGETMVNTCSHSKSKDMLTQSKHKQNKERKEPFYRKYKNKNTFTKIKKQLGFNGGIDHAEIEAEKKACSIKRAFQTFITNPRSMKPEEQLMFKLKAEEDKSWKYFIVHYHPHLYENIYGIRITSSLKTTADKHFTEELEKIRTIWK